MTTFPRPHVVLSIARRDITRLVRTRIIFWVTVLTAVVWLSAAQLRSRPEVALSFTPAWLFLAVIFLSAGVVSESLTSGAAMLDRLHGVAPLEIVLGSAAGVIAALSPSFLISVVVVLRATPQPLVGPVSLSLLWIALGAMALTTLAVLLGVLIPSAGNAIVLAPLVLAGGATPAMLPLDSLPPAAAALVRGIWSILPLEFQADAIQKTLLAGGDLVRLPPLVLLLSIPLYLSLAAVALRRQQLAARWKQ